MSTTLSIHSPNTWGDSADEAHHKTSEFDSFCEKLAKAFPESVHDYDGNEYRLGYFTVKLMVPHSDIVITFFSNGPRSGRDIELESERWIKAVDVLETLAGVYVLT